MAVEQGRIFGWLRNYHTAPYIPEFFQEPVVVDGIEVSAFRHSRDYASDEFHSFSELQRGADSDLANYDPNYRPNRFWQDFASLRNLKHAEHVCRCEREARNTWVSFVIPVLFRPTYRYRKYRKSRVRICIHVIHIVSSVSYLTHMCSYLLFCD